MAELNISSTSLGNSLDNLLTSNDEIVPGAEPSYQLCKTLYTYHPLGAKMAEEPVRIAQAQKREISVPTSPGELAKEAFEKEWKAIGADGHIFQLHTLARVYGITSIAMLVEGKETSDEIDYFDLPNLNIAFNSFDPLTTAGSLTMSQQPLDPMYLKHSGIRVSGSRFSRSREITAQNEAPVYLSWTNSAFGFVGRSVYQRALFPLKSYVRTMVTDDLVALKAGVLVAKIKQAGSVTNQRMNTMFGLKREVVKEAQTGNVISIGPEDAIESIDLKNLEGPLKLARDDILKNIATAACMPAKLLDNETFVAGFGEGTEDAKQIAQYVDWIREWMSPAYQWFDEIVMHRAWTPEFYETVQAQHPAFKDVDYKTAFYSWKNSFKATWPSLLKEPDSEIAKLEKVKAEAVISVYEVLSGALDPINKATLIEWVTDEISEMSLLFKNRLNLDIEALKDYDPQAAMMGMGDDPDGGPGDLPTVKKPLSVVGGK